MAVYCTKLCTLLLLLQINTVVRLGRGKWYGVFHLVIFIAISLVVRCGRVQNLISCSLNRRSTPYPALEVYKVLYPIPWIADRTSTRQQKSTEACIALPLL
jgi:hypothetical protein